MYSLTVLQTSIFRTLFDYLSAGFSVYKFSSYYPYYVLHNCSKPCEYLSIKRYPANIRMYITNTVYVQKNALLNIVTFVHNTSTDNLPGVLNIRTKYVQIRL